MKQNINRDQILSGNLIQAIATLAIPVVINSFLQTMYNLTDTFWLGQLGTSELAAINLVTPLQSMAQNFGSGLTVAASVLIAQYLGAREDDEARSMANQIYACAMIFAVGCAAVIILLCPVIIGWLGAEGDTYDKSRLFLSLVICDMPFLYTVNIYVAIHQACGDTVKPMFMNLGGIIINMIMDPLLMVVLHFGVAGAALATVFAKAIPAVVAFYKLNNKDQLIYLDLRHIKFEGQKIKQILAVGLPSAIGGSTTQLGFLLMSKNVFDYGTQAMAAYGIGNKVNGLISLPSNGIGSATAIIVGQNYGAGQLDRANKGYKIAMRIAVAFLLVGGLILSRPAISTACVSIFSNDQEVIAMAADFLSIMAFWCFANGVYNATNGLFQGSGHTEVNMIIDISRLWILRFGTLFFCEYVLRLGVRSVWYSVVLSNGLAALISFTVYCTGYWKKAGAVKINKEAKSE